MEQYMIYKKAITFNDFSIAAKILNTSNVADIKALGREVKNYNEIVWNGENLLGFSLMEVRKQL